MCNHFDEWYRSYGDDPALWSEDDLNTICDLHRAQLGKDCWNKWAAYYGPRYKELHDIHPPKVIHFATGDIGSPKKDVVIKLTNFEGFIFPCPMDFSNIRFQCGREDNPKTIKFKEAIFLYGVDFSTSKFDKHADFWGAEFHGDIYFEGAIFHDFAEFAHVQFKGTAQFFKVQFLNGAKFLEAIFENDAIFSNATFQIMAERPENDWEKADFLTSTFCGETYFDDCQFKTPADFSYSTFEETVTFEKSRFQEFTKFGGTNFIKAANFEECIFAKVVRFSDICALGQLNFFQAEFRGVADFERTVFFKSANFKSTIFESFVGFDYTYFGSKPLLDDNQVWEVRYNNLPTSVKDAVDIWQQDPAQIIPDFTSSVHKTPFDFSYVSIPDGEYTDVRAIAKLRRLKQIASEAYNHTLEMDFFRRELRAKLNEDTESRISKGWIRLYDVLSQCGSSFARPMLIGLGMLFLYVFAYLCNASDRISDFTLAEKFNHAFHLSAINSLPFLGVVRGESSQAGVWLFGETFSGWVSFLSISQNIFSSILLFLALLAVRNRFKL